MKNNGSNGSTNTTIRQTGSRDSFFLTLLEGTKVLGVAGIWGGSIVHNGMPERRDWEVAEREQFKRLVGDAFQQGLGVLVI